MKTLKQNDIVFNIDGNNKEVTILNRDKNYCFLMCKNSAGFIHYNTGNIWIDGDREVLAPGFITDENHYKRTKEDVYSNWYLVGIANRNQKEESKARAEAEAKEKLAKEQTFGERLTEAKALQNVAIEKLSTMIQESGSMEKLMKDSKAKSLLETISYVDAIFFHRNALSW
jgi:hypothetical protein